MSPDHGKLAKACQSLQKTTEICKKEKLRFIFIIFLSKFLSPRFELTSVIDGKRRLQEACIEK